MSAIKDFIKKLTTNQPAPDGDPRRTMTTFSGVFCPVALAQFSSVLFLRLGFAIGQVGIILTITQFFMAYIILVLTTLSICAISTNGAVKGGGVYFMISRTLGPEFGGSIGLLFYLGQVFSCALYVAGFVEVLDNNFGPGGNIIPDALPGGGWWSYLYGTLVTLFCFIISMVGGALFAKTSMIILFVVLICYGSVIVSLVAHPAFEVQIPRSNALVYHNETPANFTYKANFTGLSLDTMKENAFSKLVKDYSTMQEMSFIVVFAILFSGVTGIMNGANMSGELKRPGYAIPTGTLSATAFCLVLYMFPSILSAGSCSRKLLVENYSYMQSVNFQPVFVVIGVFCTTLSSSLGNLIGGSRILAALAKDEIFGIFLRPAKWTTRGGNPVVSVIITFILVQGVLLIGSLNAIAPITSVFFLLSYACVNLACAALDMASTVNFRPTFKWFSWHTSLIAMAACLIMCCLINAVYFLITFAISFLLVVLLQFRDVEEYWGSIGQALIFHQVRKYLLKLDSRKDHVKYWRPQVLLMVANPKSDSSLVQFVNDMKKGGLFILGHVVNRNLDEFNVDPCIRASSYWLSFVEYVGVKAFVELTMCSSVRKGFQHLCRIGGLGGMKTNVVCFGFYDDSAPKNMLSRIRKRRRAFDWVTSASFAQNNSYTTSQTGSSTFYYTRQPEPGLTPSSSAAAANLGYSSPPLTVPRKGGVENTPLLEESENIFSDNGHETSLHDITQIDDFASLLPPIRSNDAPFKASEDLPGKVGELMGPRITPKDYIGMLVDAIKMEKDVCLCRHFHLLNPRRTTDFQHFTATDIPLVGHPSSARRTPPRYIDVWPVNFFQPRCVTQMDTTSLFLLQLACILSMSSQWRSSGAELRVFLCVDAYSDDASTMKKKVDSLLSTLRITAKTYTVSWDDIVIDFEASTTNPQLPLPSTTLGSFPSNLPISYLTQVNSLIASRSKDDTAVTFLYLARPPTDPDQWINYLEQITALTDNLPPTVLAHGMHSVTSTML